VLVRLLGSSLGHASLGRRRRRSLRAVRDPLKSQKTATAPKVPRSNIWRDAAGTLAAVFTFVGRTGGALDAECGSALTSKLASGAADAVTNEDDVGPLAENPPDESGQRSATADLRTSGDALFDRLSSGPLRATDVAGADRPGFS
jgi:hypothetical protein